MIYGYFVNNPVLAVIFFLLVSLFLIFSVVETMKNLGLQKIRLYAYKWFLEAEQNFSYGENKQKFDYVIQLAKDSIPSPFDRFITENFLRKTVQLWFDLCKDFLDDGKLNNVKEEQ